MSRENPNETFTTALRAEESASETLSNSQETSSDCGALSRPSVHLSYFAFDEIR